MNGAPGRDNPWLLALGWVAAVAVGAFGVAAWIWILSGVKH